MNPLLDLFNISVANAMKLEPEVDSSLASISDGKSDGENNFEPIAEQWLNPDYRRGYWIGVLNRIGIESALTSDVETDKVTILT